MSGVERFGRVIMKVLGWLDGGSSAMDDIKSGSSFLNNDVQTDAGGNHFVKRRSQRSEHASGFEVADAPSVQLDWYGPCRVRPVFLDAAKKYNVDPRWLKAITAGVLLGSECCQQSRR